jgi:hypothetical protein
MENREGSASNCARGRPVRISTGLSYLAVYLGLTRPPNQTPGGVGTGFFWQIENALWLITTWHNVTGWDPVRDQALSRLGFTPTHVEFAMFRKKIDGDHTLQFVDARQAPLYDPDGAPLWLEHPIHRRQVDVIALSLGTIDDDFALMTVPVNTHRDWFDFDIRAGDDAFVLGYPKGLHGGHRFPIWKRASVASEPNIDLDRLPKLFVDTATREGMSGSPVIVTRKGLALKSGTSTITGDSAFGIAEKFLGIYSGRVGDDELGVQLGVVWKAKVVGEIIDGNVRGTPPWSS